MKKLFLPKSIFVLILSVLTGCVKVDDNVIIGNNADGIGEIGGNTGEPALEVLQIPSTPLPTASLLQNPSENPENTETDITSLGYELISVKYEYSIQPSMYEPNEGCYTGAYIISDKMFSGDIKSFEKDIGVDNAIYTYNMRLGGEYPQSFVLTCIANQKTPNIAIYPPMEGEKFDRDKLTETAKEFALFPVPMFIQFYPYTSAEGYKPKEYTDFFRLAKKTFEQYAPKTAFVWNVYHEDVAECGRFYPGDAYVDWAGISIYAKLRQTSGTVEFEYDDIMKDLSMFYYTYRKKKPVMVSELAVSHYTTKNNAYYNEKAAGLLAGIFDSIIADYPRVKAFVYMDVNMIERNGSDNYLITDEALIRDVYREKLQNPYYISVVAEWKQNGAQTSQVYDSAFKALKHSSGGVYIPESCLLFDFLLSKEEVENVNEYGKMIQSELYYPVENLDELFGIAPDFDGYSGENNNCLLLYKRR